MYQAALVKTACGYSTSSASSSGKRSHRAPLLRSTASQSRCYRAIRQVLALSKQNTPKVVKSMSCQHSLTPKASKTGWRMACCEGIIMTSGKFGRANEARKVEARTHKTAWDPLGFKAYGDDEATPREFRPYVRRRAQVLFCCIVKSVAPCPHETTRTLDVCRSRQMHV